MSLDDFNKKEEPNPKVELCGLGSILDSIENKDFHMKIFQFAGFRFRFFTLHNNGKDKLLIYLYFISLDNSIEEIAKEELFSLDDIENIPVAEFKEKVRKFVAKVFEDPNFRICR